MSLLELLPRIALPGCARHVKNEIRSHLESHCKIKLDTLKNEVAQMTCLFKKLLRAKNGEGTSTQPAMESLATYIPQASQNLEMGKARFELASKGQKRSLYL